jgi:hypothetical protein
MQESQITEPNKNEVIKKTVPKKVKEVKEPKESKLTFNCDKCGFVCDKQSKLLAHCKTQKHINNESFTATELSSGAQNEVITEQAAVAAEPKKAPEPKKHEPVKAPTQTPVKMSEPQQESKVEENKPAEKRVPKVCACGTTLKSLATVYAHQELCKAAKAHEMVERTNKAMAEKLLRMQEEEDMTEQEKEISRLNKRVNQLQMLVNSQNNQIVELVKNSADDTNAAQHINNLKDFLESQCKEVVMLKDFLMTLIKKITNEAFMISAGDASS